MVNPSSGNDLLVVTVLFESGESIQKGKMCVWHTYIIPLFDGTDVCDDQHT